MGIFLLCVTGVLPPLNAYFRAGTVVGLWFIGQLAAWQPARRAPAVSPAAATRAI